MPHNRHHAAGSGFVEEIPHDDAQQKRHGEVRHISTELQEPDEHEIHDGEQHQWLEHRPDVSQEGLLVTKFEVGANHRLQ